MRATTNGISVERSASARQPARLRTWASVTRLSSQLRTRDSSTTRSETGRRDTRPSPACSSTERSWKRPLAPGCGAKLRSVSGRGIATPGSSLARRALLHLLHLLHHLFHLARIGVHELVHV